jgi:pimeloyl-ACP methyl ester carboxylesterase
MPTETVRDIAMHYETEGSGDPLVLIPYLSADHACYAFQTPEYSKHFTCVAVDLRGAGTTDKPAGPYSAEQSADDVAGLMEVLGIDRAHVAGVSFGAAAGMWLAAKYPDRVASLSLHSAWAKTDPFVAAVVKGWQVMAQALGSVAEMVIQGIFPWCFTPEPESTDRVGVVLMWVERGGAAGLGRRWVVAGRGALAVERWQVVNASVELRCAGRGAAARSALVGGRAVR